MSYDYFRKAYGATTLKCPGKNPVRIHLLSEKAESKFYVDGSMHIYKVNVH